MNARSLLLLILVLAGCGPRAEEVSGRSTPVAVRPVVAETGFAVERVFIGEVRARRAGTVGFEVPGTLNELDVEVGDAVEAGAVLARLDTDRLHARLRDAEASVAEAQAQLTLARSTLARTQEARRGGAVSPQAEDEAANAVAGAEARLARAEALVAVIEVDLEKSVLRAPYAATVDARLLDLGATVTAGQGVLRLVERERPEIRFTASAEAAAEWRVGQRIPFSAPGVKAEGALVRIREQRDAATRSVEAFLEVDDSLMNGLRPGTVVSVRLPAKVSQAGFWLERQALTEGTRGLWACFVAVPMAGNSSANGATHRLERVDLEWLHEAGDRVFVRGPLQAGDAVVREGLHRLVPGLSVRLAPTSDTAR